MTYYTYILQCADGTFYTGVTKNLQKRLVRHNSGNGARYTRGRLPVALVHFEESSNIKTAMKREREIRQLPRSKKKKLIKRRKLLIMNVQ
jgi:putative endonuclease